MGMQIPRIRFYFLFHHRITSRYRGLEMQIGLKLQELAFYIIVMVWVTENRMGRKVN